MSESLPLAIQERPVSESGPGFWVALRRHHRPHAHRYATHVLGQPPGPTCDALLDRALDRACRSLGERRRRPPTDLSLSEIRDRLQLAVRHEVWRTQRRRVRWPRLAMPSRRAPSPRWGALSPRAHAS